MTDSPRGRARVDPIAQFMQEHEKLLVQLSMLNRATREMADKGFTAAAFKRVLETLEYIEDEVVVHNKREEEALFPVLERYVEGPTSVMRAEHKSLQKDYFKVRRAAAAVSRHRADRRRTGLLREISQSMVHSFVNHIYKENHILFPLVQKFLTKDALREVARRMV